MNTPPIENPLVSIQYTFNCDSRDWSVGHRDAWVYGIVVGWDEGALEEVAQDHRWTPETVERLKRLRKRWIELAESSAGTLAHSCPVDEFERRYDRADAKNDPRINVQVRALRMIKAVAETANELGRRGHPINDVRLEHHRDNCAGKEWLEIKLVAPLGAPGVTTIQES